MKKIRFLVEHDGSLYYRDQILPFVPIPGDRVYLPANKSEQLGLFTVSGKREWSPILPDVLVVTLEKGDGVHIPGPCDIGSSPCWHQYQEMNYLEIAFSR